MRKIIYSMNVSLDGFIAGPDGNLDWVAADDELHRYYADQLNKVDLILYGRVTFQMLADYWPTASADPSLTPGEIHFADAINTIPKIVYSNTLEKVGWNASLAREINVEKILDLKRQPGKNIEVSGGPAIVRTFSESGLIDEYQLLIHPVILGAGKPLFAGIKERLNLNLLSTSTLKSGVVCLCYQTIPR